ncbi:hypothetical protein JNB91_23900 [Rhizobium wenxiniae]|uniref:hypothetical protein n=1 Tax=Rhizobium wenxiniae TaxID=1737357 RepID=UPI001C6E1AFC|nr:hypothetical protein [Rhizobium wenxiniae]MBW9090860.1 hypothetical protein [Rhizobium wenxiniae]
MSAVAILKHHVKPLSSMSDEELQCEHDYWYAELRSAYLWDKSPEVALQAIENIELVMRDRRVAEIRAGRLGRKPVVVDDPGVKPIHIEVMGAAKTRAEYVPSRALIIAASVILGGILAGATAATAMRLAEYNAQLGWAIV